MMAGIPDKVLVKDDTLREGEEQPNHKPITVEMKVKVARELEAAGLTETEVGFPATLPAHFDLCKTLRREGIRMRLSAHPNLLSPRWKENLERTAEAGVDVVYMLFPATDDDLFNLEGRGIQMAKAHLTEDLCKFVRETVEYAKGLGFIARGPGSPRPPKLRWRGWSPCTRPSRRPVLIERMSRMGTAVASRRA